MGSFASFLLNHFADRLDAIEPTVPFGFGLERRRGNEIAISRMKHFSSREPIPGILWAIADAVVRDVDDLVVVCLNGESHIESKDAVAHVSQGVAGWRNDLSLNLRPSTHPSGWLTTLNVSSIVRVSNGNVECHKVFALD
jgi:hypothetical protein